MKKELTVAFAGAFCTVVLLVATWIAGWELYHQELLWQIMENTRYQNYLIGMMLAENLLCFAVIRSKIRQLQPTDATREKQPQKPETKPLQEQDPPEDSQFIKLVARVNAIENEQHQIKKEIKSIRNFANLLPQKPEAPEK